MRQLKSLSLILFIAFMLMLSACNLSSASEDNAATVTPVQTAVSVPTTVVVTATAQPAATATVVVVPTAAVPEVCYTDGSWPAYIVQSGDTLSNLAARVNSTVEILTQTNCLTNPNTLTAGQTLYVPVLPIPGVPLPALHDNPSWTTVPVYTTFGAPPADKCVVTTGSNPPVPLYRVANVSEPYNGTLGGWAMWMSTVNDFHQIVVALDQTTIFNAFVRLADVSLQGPCPAGANQ